MEESVEYMIKNDVNDFIEIGPESIKWTCKKN